jgi:hypothetical protein
MMRELPIPENQTTPPVGLAYLHRSRCPRLDRGLLFGGPMGVALHRSCHRADAAMAGNGPLILDGIFAEAIQ